MAYRATHLGPDEPVTRTHLFIGAFYDTWDTVARFGRPLNLAPFCLGGQTPQLGIETSTSLDLTMVFVVNPGRRGVLRQVAN